MQFHRPYSFKASSHQAPKVAEPSEIRRSTRLLDEMPNPCGEVMIPSLQSASTAIESNALSVSINAPALRRAANDRGGPATTVKPASSFGATRLQESAPSGLIETNRSQHQTSYHSEMSGISVNNGRLERDRSAPRAFPTRVPLPARFRNRRAACPHIPTDHQPSERRSLPAPPPVVSAPTKNAMSKDARAGWICRESRPV